MQLGDFQNPFCLSNESVKVLDCEEKSLFVHIICHEHLVHPVDHAGATHLSDIMSKQVVAHRTAILRFELEQIGIDHLTILCDKVIADDRLLRILGHEVAHEIL